jgi:hypothetical protein
MNPWMCSEINLLIWSQSNDIHQHITGVAIFAIAVVFPVPLQQPFGAIAASEN